MDNESLQIRDEDRSTQGGPPGWMAYLVILVAGTVLIAGFALMLALML